MENKLTILAKKVIYGFALLFLVFLCVTTVVFRSDGYEVSVNSWDVTIRIAIAIGISFLLYFVSCLIERCPIAVQYGMLLALFAGVMYFCWWWIINSASLPQSDAISIYDIARRARDHDLLPIAPRASYMSLWPFQAGLVMFVEIILRLVPDAEEMTLQLMYLPFMALSLVSAYMLVRRLFPHRRTRIYWCILMAFCLPYYFYVNNMYGEIPSMALMFFSLWMISCFLNTPSWWSCLLAGLGMAGAVAIRKNSVIILIACILILAILSFRRKIIIIGVLILASMMGSILPGKIYEHRAHNEMGKGVPAVSYIAMGLQWTEGRSPGAWNGYHSDLFINCDYDREKAIELSRASIRESLEYMRENPGYAMRFFCYKLTEQWCREDFSCLYSTLSRDTGRSAAAWDIYQGSAKDKFMDIMSIHQGIVYFGALLFCILNGIVRREGLKKSLWKLVLLVSFIGGFLFSILWEGGSRYVMPFFVMLIPYAAEAISKLHETAASALTAKV
ncbi:MAG: glycosyltransferase family 39 protein [Acetatifactor sp.]|nr:glycosyltransferase family 39 protein [Acetatifactor sp.]